MKNTKRPVHLTAGPQLVILTRTFSKAHAANYVYTVLVADRLSSLCVVARQAILQ